MKITKLLSAKLLSALLLSFSTSALAGPIIIAGTDADDHGWWNGSQNMTGWAFMQKAFEIIGGAVTNGNKSVVCLGCNGSAASAAFNSATGLSSLAGSWSFMSLSSEADIAAFFSRTGAQHVGNTGIIYMPTVESNVSGGISDDQLLIVNTQGNALNAFVGGGGGLFTQEQINSAIGYGWLTSLIPGFTVRGDGSGGVWESGTLQLTPAGRAAFPGLTDIDMSNATPWHAWFENYGALQPLAVGDGNGFGGMNDAVIIGGGVGAMLACGTPGQPPCPPAEVPEPASLPLLAAGGLGLLAWRRKRAKQ